MIQKMIFLFLGLLPNLLFADETVAAATTSKNSQFCPSIDQLHRDPVTMLWNSKEKTWRSYTASFTSTLSTFLGAQWQGVKVGTLFCLYQGQKMTFPVTLQYAKLVYEPSGGKWAPNKLGLRNCKSSDQKDCSFIPRAQETDTGNNLYDSLKSLRSAPSQQDLGF